jgi:hypothetical protein
MKNAIRITRRRGRPFGHRLSETTKNKIRRKRLGTHHSQETKDKISQSLTEYFEKRDLLSASIEHEYSYISDEAAEWVHDNRKAIDESEYVITEKRLSYFKQMELNVGNDIEYLYGHNSTPEFLMMLKEEIAERFGKEGVQELCSLI